MSTNKIIMKQGESFLLVFITIYTGRDLVASCVWGELLGELSSR